MEYVLATIKTLYVIHHSHTDIGYTHGQSRIVRWHAAFIRQAMRLAERREDFAWTCETLYPVEQFWQDATAREKETFARLVRAGRIGLSGGYLHLNELPDAALLAALAQRARRFASLGMPIGAAMHADINGCPLSHARALADAGIGFLLMCVHPHHGYVPLGKREALFRWDLGDGRALNVCHSDHYHTGNELGLSPADPCNYTAGFTDPPARFDDDVLERRLPVYLRRVEASGWDHDFLVLAVSGLSTDNSPPSELVVDRIARWNAKHGSAGTRIEMTTPGRLAEIVASIGSTLPVHRGDWTDWWCDGAAGDPEAIALFRLAQRERRWLAALPAPPNLETLDESLALFAEHTFGHSAAMSAPWNLLAQQLRLRKLGFAAAAADGAQILVDQATDALGGGALACEQPMTFRAFNPLSHPVRDLVTLEMEGGEDRRWNLDDQVRIVRRPDGAVLAHQVAPSLRGRSFVVDLELPAGGSVDLSIEPAPPAPRPMPTHPILPDRARDVREDHADVPPTRLGTDHVQIAWAIGEGITQWTATDGRRDLIDRQAGAAPFALRASRLPAPADGQAQCTARRRLGRNRNAADAAWSASRLVRAKAQSSGEHSQSVLLDYQMDGFELLQVRLEARRHQPRVDVEVIAHKIGTWDVENVYLALPFSGGPAARLWIDRGYPMRPGVDQLPGTVLDYMGAQDGLGWSGTDYGVAITQLDSHLIQLGPLDYGVRQLAGEEPEGWRPACAYAWLMTNYWETNFAPEVGGFYSFRFAVQWGQALRDPDQGWATCRAASLPIHAFRLAGGA